MKLLSKLLAAALIVFCSCLFAQCNAGDRPIENELGVPPVLQLSGTPYQLGLQHGRLLKKAIAHNVKRLIDDQILAHQEIPQISEFLGKLPSILKFVPEAYLEEINGLAEGAEVPFEKLLMLNLFPEMFHCLGLTVAGENTEQGALYHVRVLDYAVGVGLQDTAVLMVVKPEGKIPFVNVSYAGFIGCVTGMNEQKIAVGEIGGKGYGKNNGMAMPFLLRQILEEATSLDEVKELLSAEGRTCEYYYVFSDGKTKQAVGVYATTEQLHFIPPGSSYALLDQGGRTSQVDKLVLGGSQIENSPFQTVLYREDKREKILGLIHRQPVDCVAITGFSYPERYPILMDRLGMHLKKTKIGVAALQEMLKPPVTRAGNLHNAIFAPETLEVWIAHAGPQGEPASLQPYAYYSVHELFKTNH